MTGYSAARIGGIASFERLFPKYEVVPDSGGPQLPLGYEIVREREKQSIRYYWIGPSFKPMKPMAEMGAGFETTPEARDSCLRHIDTTQDESKDTQQ